MELAERDLINREAAGGVDQRCQDLYVHSTECPFPRRPRSMPKRASSG